MKDSFDDLKNLKDERPELPDLNTDFEDLKKVKYERPEIETTDVVAHFGKIRDYRSASNKPDLSPLSY
nr:unnamed protein product [Callosobruchus chinensis]